MSVFLDTSAILPLLDADDEDHRSVRDSMDRLLDAQDGLLTSNYVVVESAALLQRRIGLEAVEALRGRVLPLLEVIWVDPGLHEAAFAALVAAGRRGLSLVDWVSFEAMRREGIVTALALDDDFAAQGFAVVP